MHYTKDTNVFIFRNYTLFDMADAVALRHGHNAEPVPKSAVKTKMDDSLYLDQYDTATEEYFYEDNIIQSSSSTPVLVAPDKTEKSIKREIVKNAAKSDTTDLEKAEKKKKTENIKMDEETKEKMRKNQDLLDILLGLTVRISF